MIGKIIRLDEDYSKHAKWCNENEAYIEELEADENGRKFIIKANVIDLVNKEIAELKDWFDVYYTQHEQKYRRLIALEKLCDDKTEPEDKLVELYKQAETKRKRIQELEA